MIVSAEALRRQAEAVKYDDEHGWFTWGVFDRLLAVCLVREAEGTVPQGLRRHLRVVRNRLSDMRTSAAKLEWLHGLRTAGHLEEIRWMYYATNDVTSFVTAARSLMDNLAEAYDAASTQPGTLPTSFRKLRQKLTNEPDGPMHSVMPAGIPDIVRACEWFVPLREMRDGVIHRSAETIVLPRSESISVIFAGGGAAPPSEDWLVGNNNLVNFEWFAAAVSARVHELLEDSAERIAALHFHGLEDNDLPGWSVHFGLETVDRWTRDLLHEMKG